MAAINFQFGSGLTSITYSIYDIAAGAPVSTNTLQYQANPKKQQQTQSIDLSTGSTTGKQYRIYFYSKALPLSGEPDGMSDTTLPFSFIEYNINANNQISLDTSYINDWAFPIQINDGSNTYGFQSANGVISKMTSQPYASFLPASASATKNGPIGSTVDLYDPVNKRFIGPLSIFANQSKWAGWTQANAWSESNWAGTSATPWLQFSADVPFGAMPYSGAGATPPGLGFLPSSTASQTSAVFPALPAANAHWPDWIKATYTTYPTPQYGFDFSTAYPFNPANTNDTSGENQTLPTNFAVWNEGYSYYEPSIPANNVSPDHYTVNGTAYNNGYTAALRAQAATDGGQHSINNQPKNGFFTFPLDNFNGEFNNYNPASITLIVSPLATITTVGTAVHDVITGTDGDDVVLGGGGGDVITGGGPTSRSSLGHGGRDTFVYNLPSESKPGRGRMDRITDFGSEDWLDVSGFDANRRKAGRQPFRWIGNAAFSGKAGELRYQTREGGLVVQGSLDHDHKAEFQLFLAGVQAIGTAQLNL